MIPQVLVPLAHGFEEIEATCPVDLLKRAEVEVVLASCETELEVCGRSGIIIRTDQFLMETKPDRFDLLVIPGGPAVFELRKNKAILSFNSRICRQAATNSSDLCSTITSQRCRTVVQ